jgi:hypothetical protein
MTHVAPSSWTEFGRLPPSPEGRMRFTRQAYHQMLDVGVLNPNDRLELLDGEIMMMSPIGPNQSGLIRRLTDFFVKHLPDSIECSIQLPLAVSDHSEPEPDVALVRRRDDDYRTEHPGPEDVVLIIEVAQSSRNIDLGIKLRLYAEAGIKEYWVVDVDHKSVIVHRQLQGAEYRDVQSFGPGSTIAPIDVPSCPLDVGNLFR